MFSSRSHPDEGQLLRFCEGELPVREASRIEDHVRGCWECNTHIDDMRQLIGEYVHYRRDVLRPSLPPPPAPWGSLSREFQRIRDDETTGRGFLVFRRPLVWVAAGLMVLVAAASSVIWIHPGSHSAVPRSEVHERKPADPVEYRASQLSPKRSVPLPRSPAVQQEQVGPDDELKVIAALHRIGADLGDPVEVTRQPERIVIRGAGLEPDRIVQLRASVAAIPHVSFDFAAPAPPATDTSPVVVQSGRSSPVQAQIARQFADHAAFQQFADQTLEASEEMLARAHALRALADRFPANVESEMSANSIGVLSAIRDEHMTALANAVDGIDRSVMPVLRSLHVETNSPPAPSVANWRELAGPLLSTAERMDRVIGTMLATTTVSSVGSLSPPAVGAVAGSPGAPDSARSLDGLSASALGTQLAGALSKIKTDLAALQRLSVDGQTRGGR